MPAPNCWARSGRGARTALTGSPSRADRQALAEDAPPPTMRRSPPPQQSPEAGRPRAGPHLASGGAALWAASSRRPANREFARRPAKPRPAPDQPQTGSGSASSPRARSPAIAPTRATRPAPTDTSRTVSTGRRISPTGATSPTTPPTTATSGSSTNRRRGAARATGCSWRSTPSLDLQCRPADTSRLHDRRPRGRLAGPRAQSAADRRGLPARCEDRSYTQYSVEESTHHFVNVSIHTAIGPAAAEYYTE